MSLDECKAKHTYRQMLAWNRWLDEELNRPGRIEHYLMRIAGEIRRVVNSFWWVKTKTKDTYADMTVKFERGAPNEPETPLDGEELEQAAEENMNWSKAVWAMAGAMANRNEKVRKGNLAP